MTDVDLVAKRTGTKVSAQWSNDEVVHQILVDLLGAEENSDAAKELLKRVHWIKRQSLILGIDWGVTIEEG